MSRPEPIRLLELAGVPALRSQTVFHAAGYEMGTDGPDTILLVTPGEPYVSIGFHQDPAVELDLEACHELELPVVRREVGGGAVYLDRGQVFCQWIFRADRLPASLAERFELYARPLVETYRAFGIPAEYRPVNDIHVAGRKIGGTGAARIGEAEIMVGSLMFEFRPDLMARVLRVSSEKMRDKVATALRDYVTSMSRELESPPPREAVARRYLEECAAALGRPLEPGALSPAETRRAERLDRTMGSRAWTFQRRRRDLSGVKIHEDVHVHEGTHKAPAGLVRVTVVVRSGAIEDLSITGDFTLLPQAALDQVEAALRGLPADPARVEEGLIAAYARLGVDAPGLPPSEVAAAIGAALGSAAPRVTGPSRVADP